MALTGPAIAGRLSSLAARSISIDSFEACFEECCRDRLFLVVRSFGGLRDLGLPVLSRSSSSSSPA